MPFGVLEVGKGEMKGAAGERYKQMVSRVRPRGIQNWIGASGNGSASRSALRWRCGTTRIRQTFQNNHPAPATGPPCFTTKLPRRGSVVPPTRRSPLTISLSPPIRRGGSNGQRHGVEANAPLIAVVNPPKTPAPSLPVSRSFFSLDSNHLMLSTMKKSEDDGTVTVRVYNSGENAIDTQIELFSPLSKAEETNLLEEHGTLLAHKDNRVNICVGWNAVSTFKLTPP